MYGRYSTIPDSLLDYYKKCETDQVIWYRDYINFESIQAKSFDNEISTEITCVNPCLAIFWKAQNMSAKETNYYSNYTSDKKDHRQGWDPITKNTLIINGNILFEKQESYLFNSTAVTKRLPSAPDETGYHAHLFANELHHNDANNTEVFPTKSILICILGDNNIYNRAFYKKTQEDVSDLIDSSDSEDEHEKKDKNNDKTKDSDVDDISEIMSVENFTKEKPTLPVAISENNTYKLKVTLVIFRKLTIRKLDSDEKNIFTFNLD
jgi:hypothetical protein